MWLGGAAGARGGASRSVFFCEPAIHPRLCFPRRVRILILLILAVIAPGLFARDLAIPENSRQLVLVSADSWQSDSGTLQRCSRNGPAQPWRNIGPPVPVQLGRAGLAWGLGLHAPVRTGPQKREGDGKSPAGVFALTAAFGYGPRPAGVRLPYIVARPGIEAVDDPHSRYYNRIVDRARIAQADWHSSETMRLPGDEYRLGVVVAHNPRCLPGAGSCIFLHVASGSHRGTAGCTAMPLRDIAELQRWLDPGAHPILVQAPRGFR